MQTSGASAFTMPINLSHRQETAARKLKSGRYAHQWCNTHMLCSHCTVLGHTHVTSLVSIRNKNSENPNNSVVLSVERGGYERRCSFSAPFGEGDVVSKKLESDHVRPVGSELRTRLRDRVGGTALTDLYATGTCISQSRSKLPLGRDRESAPERGDITDMSALRRDDKRAWLRLSTVCGPKEGQRHQTSCEPEGSQFSCPTDPSRWKAYTY